MTVGLIVAALLVAANGFFVATEFAIARLRRTQVEEWAQEGRPGAKSALHAVDHIDAYLAACQLGITLASLGLGVSGEPAFHDLLEPVFGDAAKVAGVGLASAVAFGIITLLHVVLGELSPKSLAIARTERTALFLAPPMRVFYFLTKPLVDLFNGLGNLVLKPFGVPPANEVGHDPHSEQELRALVRQSADEGLIEREERDLATRAFAFDDRRVREIMRPRADIAHVREGMPRAEVVTLARGTGHTRFPLVPEEGGLDEALGLVHVKDLLGGDGVADEAAFDLRALCRPVAHLSESTFLGEVLRELRAESRHLALVHDERGTVTGLVTLEDVVEQLVGAIQDEFDADEEELLRREGGVLVVDGGAPIRLLARELRLDLDDLHEATVGGHVVEVLGRVPDVGECVDLEGHRVEVTAVEETRVTQVRIAAPERAG